MSNKLLGILALIGAPWLFIGTYLEQQMPQLSDSWFTGVWGIIFISGWMCAVVALKRLKAGGSTSFGQILLTVLLIALSIANISNVIQIIVEKEKPSYFMFFDLFWPLSNIIMLIVGIMVIVAKRLQGWKRYIPLATGMWFPLAMLTSLIDNGIVSFIFGGFYSAIAWALLAIVIIITRKETEAVITKHQTY
jgi:hypothetical protein